MVATSFSPRHRIIEPLTSRCSKFRFKPLAIAVMKTRLLFIIQEEGVACEEGVTVQVIEASGGDLRKAITLVQSASHIKGKESITSQDIVEIAGVRGESGSRLGYGERGGVRGASGSRLGCGEQQGAGWDMVSIGE